MVRLAWAQYEGGMPSRAGDPSNAKELYRLLDELTLDAFEGAQGPEAVRLAAERVVLRLGRRLGIRAVRLLDPQDEEALQNGGDVASLHIEHAEARQRPFVVGFELGEEAVPERVEFVLHTLSSILSSRLLESAFGNTMRQAEEIQRSLIPQHAPAFDGYEIALRSISAERVGGDFYDFLELDEDTLGLAVGDASGHGLPAALLVRDVVVGLRMGMEKDLKPGHTLSRLNQVIHESSLSSCFVSVFYAELERNGSLFYFNAGHEPPLLFGGGDTRLLARGDTVIGPLAEARFKRHFAHLDRGATLVLYTDGLLERRNDLRVLFGIERLERAIQANLRRPVGEIVERVIDEADAFGGGRAWEDDVTLVVVRRLP
jgi:serine phosphatase RsbU (regulator of sigma subunit)